jgi:hypothetical protein
MNRAPAACAIGVLACCAGTLPAAAADDARSIVAAALQQDNGHDVFMSAGFEVFDREGHSTTKSFTYRRVGSAGDSRTLVVFTDPADIRGVALLSINRPGLVDRQYIFVPATQRVRGVAQQQRAARFIGTDFSFEDVEERQLDDFSYRLLGDGGVIAGHRTRRIEATPVEPDRSQYRFLDYWVAQDVPVIVQVEMHDGQGALVRVLRASELRRVSGLWGARRLEMSSVQEGTRTVLYIRRARFNTHPDAALFTPQGLGAPQALDGPPGDDAGD